jgi:hypothetical protein
VDANGRAPLWPHLTASTEVTIQGVRIGIVGLLTENAAEVIKRPNFDGLRAAPLAPAAEREALRLRKAGADLIVIVAHEGGECARFEDPSDLSSCNPESEIFRLARALPKGLVDVIVGGHKNAAVAHIVEGIPVVHAPSNRQKKGTQYVIDACAQLPVELDIVENLPHEQARERYERADIVVDQLNAGWHGVFALEAMALGKPVVVHLKPEVVAQAERAYGTKVPLVPATKETLVDALRPLVESPALRRQIGAASRAYVERVHDIDRIADRLLDIYARL